MDRKPQVMVFRPTMEEFKDFPRFIAHMEEHGAHKVGLAKIIPPNEWIPRKSGYDDIDLTIPAPIMQQCVYGSKGTFKVFNVAKKPMTVKEYRQMANSDKYRTPANRGYEDLERKFWTNVAINQPIYGADVSGTVTDADQHVWNIGHLGTILDCIGDVRIEGVNTAYLYFGMWKAMFAWHTEDMDLYSINYLHDGAPKAWYGIPPQHGQRFERLAAGLFPDDAKQCSAFLRHKMYLISPRTLRESSIPFFQTWQEKGEFMITFPYAYHAGYNLGYNCAESTNFASERWIEYGKYCNMCHCNSDMVRISMDPFVREFQPDKYELWRAGLEVGTHPENELSKLYSRPRHTAARPAKLPQPQLPAQQTHKDTMIKPQVSRRIPILKLPVKASTSDVHSDFDATDVSETETSIYGQSMTVGAVSDNSQQSALNSSSSLEGNVCKKTDRHHASDHQDVVKKLRLQKLGKDISLTSPVKAGHSQNVAALGAEHLGRKTATVTYVGSGLMSLPSSVLSGASETPLLSYTLYTPFIESGQSPSGSQLTDVSSRQSTASHLPTVGSSLVQTLTAANCDTSSVDASVIDTEVVETIAGQSSLSHAQKQCHVKNQKRNVNRGSTSISQRLSSVAGLLQFMPADISAVTAYNKHEATLPPHCCICSLFVEGNDRRPVQTVATSSQPLIPPEIFLSRSSPHQEMSEHAPMSSSLAVCSHCGICVHQSCYGGDTLCPQGYKSSQWLCDRCFWGNLTDACCLCKLRGGALKRTTRGCWVHIVCMLVLPEFSSVSLHEKFVAISVAVSPQRKLCVYCRQRGQLIECSSDKCISTFHVTCGHAVGAKFEVVKSPFRVSVTCPAHKLRPHSTLQRRCRANMLPVAAGDRVIAKHRNGRYYRALVLSFSDVVYYKVAFDDGTYSNDMYPEDIELPADSVRPPAVGTPVQVRWVDGNLYSAVFKGINDTSLVEAQFEDGSILSTERTKVWAESEELPATVASRLSEATDTKYNLFVSSPEAKSRTRQRKPQYIRDDNFVVPSGLI